MVSRWTLLCCSTLMAMSGGCSRVSESAPLGRQPSADVEASGEVSEHEERALVIVGELADLGFEIDLERLSIEVSDTEDCWADVDRQQDMFFPETYFTGFLALLECLGLNPTDVDAVELRALSVETLAQQMSAYYQADREALVFPRNRLNAFVEGMGQLDYLIAHELVHAYQDQQLGGLEQILSAGGRTREQVEIARCVIEGHGEIVAMALLQERQGASVEEISTETLDLAADLESIFVSSAALYDAGRRLVLDAFQRGGWDGVNRLYEERPSSTEQILHPEKRGKDLPWLPAPAPWRELWPDATVVHEDVLGELCFQTLLGSILPRSEGYAAATGWDGDRLLVLNTPAGEMFTHWRGVWDRDEDARQFAAGILSAGGHALSVNGRVVDAFFGPEDMVSALRNVLPLGEDAAGPEDLSAGASTAAAEAARYVEPARLEGDRWIRPDVGVSLAVPPGWSEQSLGGMSVLLAEGKNGGAGTGDNVTMIKLPNPLGDDLDTLEQLNRDQFESLPNAELISMEQVLVDGIVALQYEATGPFAGGREMLLRGLLIPRGQSQIVISVITASEGAERLAADAMAMLASVKFLDEE
ncbi:MAG: hypothetical protein ACI9EF_001271 [Pseudohongiellaceae bacterium]|jgi:hypothetical protein